MKKNGILTLALLTSINFVWSDQGNGRDLFDLSIEELLKIKVSVATRQPIASQDAPSNITLFTRTELKVLGIRRLTELMEYIPGFYPMYNPVEGNQSYLLTRGHAQKYASTLLVLYNGQRINEDYTGGINYFTRFLNLECVDKIEVVRGPGSVVYGSNAFNGVINIVSQYEPSVTFTQGSPNTQSFDLAYRTLSNNWEVGLGVNWEDDRGDTFSVAYDPFNLQTTTSDPKRIWQLNYQVKNQDFVWNGLYLRSDRHNYYLFRRLRDGQTHVHLDQWLNSWKLDLLDEVNYSLKMNFETNHAKRKSQTAIALQDNANFIEADYLEGELFEYRSYRYNVDAVAYLNEQHKINHGVEYVVSSLPKSFLRSNYNIFGNYEYLGTMTTFGADDQRFVLNRKRKIHSAYTEWEAEWNPQNRMTVGLRYDHFNDVKARTNPRFSWIYVPSDFHRFKLIYAEAYRAPSLGDLYDVESGLTSGNVNLNPSVLESMELVYLFSNGGHYFSTTLFHNHISDLIAFRVDQNNNVFLANVADNQASGLELEWRSNWQSIVWSGHANYWFENETQQGSGDGATPSEDLSPKWFLQNRLSWSVTNDLTLSWIYHLRDSVKTLQDKSSLGLSHVALNYQQNQRLSWQLKIRNLTDKRYAIGSYIPLNQTSPVYQEYPARGREIWLSLRLNLDD
jgi:iron complex outermembrane receptor protein